MNYDLYGIGNALVDVEIEITPDELERLGLDKGLMTLVDQDQHQSLMDKVMGMKHVRSCGGSAANSVIALAQLGGKAFYSCRVGNDEAGEFYKGDLQENGVTVNSKLAQSAHTLNTGHCLVLITPDADRTMATYLGITETLASDVIDSESLQASKCLYIEGYLVTSPTGQKAAIDARSIAEDSGVHTSLTFSDPGVVAHFREGFQNMLGPEGVHYLFCNEAEALSFTQMDSLEKAMAQLQDVAQEVCITRSEKGAWVWSREQNKMGVVRVSAPPTSARDSNGAGDAFAGAYLYARTQGASPEASATLAVHFASKVVSQFGSRLSRDSAQAVLQDWTKG